MATPPKTMPLAQSMLSVVTAQRLEAKKYYEECAAWAEHLTEQRAEKEQLVKDAQRQMVDVAKQQAEALKKLKQAKDRYEALDEQEDHLSDLVSPKTSASTWALAAQAARRPEAKEFLTLLAAYKLQREAMSLHESASSSSSHQVPESTSASRSSKRPRSPDKKLARSKRAYVS